MANEDNLDRGDDFTPTGVDAREMKLGLEKQELEDKLAAEAEAAAKAKEEADAKAKEELEEGDKTDLEGKEEDEIEHVDGSKKDDAVSDKRSKVIPRERFDAAQQKARAREEALQAKIADLEKQTAAQRMSADVQKLTNAIDDLQEKYEDAVLDGKKEEARAIRKELAKLQDVFIEVKTQVSSEAAKREAIQELKYDAALAKAEVDHPELNPDSEEYDPALTDEVGVLLESFVLRGFTRDVALAKAVRYVVGAPAKRDPDNVDPKKVAESRAVEARKKAADALKKQPPALVKPGIDSDKGGNTEEKGIDIMRVSQERFSKIDEETLARLRGDTL